MRVPQNDQTHTVTRHVTPIALLFFHYSRCSGSAQRKKKSEYSKSIDSSNSNRDPYQFAMHTARLCTKKCESMRHIYDFMTTSSRMSISISLAQHSVCLCVCKNLNLKVSVTLRWNANVCVRAECLQIVSNYLAIINARDKFQ